MNKREHKSKEELEAIAEDVLSELKPRRLPVWQVKEVLRFALKLAEGGSQSHRLTPSTKF